MRQSQLWRLTFDGGGGRPSLWAAIVARRRTRVADVAANGNRNRNAWDTVDYHATILTILQLGIPDSEKH